MLKKKVSVIFGTRPEAIKLAPVILLLKKHPDLLCHVCVTAQHRQMLDQVLHIFGIVPDTDLNLMEVDQTLGGFTARAVETLDRYLTNQSPDLVLIQGDTTTIFCAAVVSFYHRIPVGHVEAGLRTGDLYSPWPEEANRTLASRLSTLHFAPTENNRKNLIREGIPPDHILVTGNTVIDALLIAVQMVRKNVPTIPGLPENITAPTSDRPLVLITSHRRENFGQRFHSICGAIAVLAERFPETAFVYPVHLNPNIRASVFHLLAGRENIYLVEPLNYLQFVALMDRSTLIMTDSGGIQEEAPTLGKPVLVVRESTERPEAIDAGTAKLVGTEINSIVDHVSHLLVDRRSREAMSRVSNPYGDGMSAARIVEACAKYLQTGSFPS